MARPSVDPGWATDAAYSAGTDPWSGQPNKVAPSSGQIGQGLVPQTKLPYEWLNWKLGNHGDWIEYLDTIFAGDLFGDGSDGSYTLDGTQAAVGGLFSKVGSVYTLLRDAYFQDLTVTGVNTILMCGGARLFVAGTLTTAAGGSVRSQGSNGAIGSVGGAGGAGAPSITLGGGKNGGTGNTTNGVNGTAATNSYGGSGGAGGSEGGAGPSSGGSATAPTNPSSPIAYSAALFGWLLTGTTGLFAIIGGGGGGGGAGDSVHTGGGGGGGGGVLAIAARFIILENATDLLAIGGTGGDGQTGGGTATGGGGGGGGGALLVAYMTKQLAGGGTPVFTAAANCFGGVGGSGFGGGNNGATGSNGIVFDIGIGTGTPATFLGQHVEKGFVTMAPGTTSVTINFGQNFTTVTGAGGYQVEASIYRSDGGPAVSWWISTKATDHMVISFEDDFTGEFSWRAEQ